MSKFYLRKLIARVFFCFMITQSIVGCTRKPDKGIITRNSYINKFFRVKFPLPHGWYILSDAEITAEKDPSLIVVSQDDLAENPQISQIGFLEILKNAPDVEALNPNIKITINDTRSYELESGVDFLLVHLKNVHENPKWSSNEDISLLEIKGGELYYLDIVMSDAAEWGITIYSRMFAAIIEDHLFIITLTAQDMSTLEELTDIVKKFEFDADVSTYSSP